MIAGLRRPATPVTVFVHVFYPDIWQGISRVLAERLRRPFHLVLTTPHDPGGLAVPDTPQLLSTNVIPVENRGRDILPFLQAVAAAPPFEIGLKLHTKKSPQRDDGARWLQDVLDSLLPSPRRTGALVDRLIADGRIGLVAPAGFSLSVRPWVLVNAPGMNRVMAALGHALTGYDLENAYFAAGSMFWFRRAAVAALASEPVMRVFEPEEGQLDGTAAHATERLFPVEARRQGYVSLAVPALMASRRTMSDAALQNLARRHADIPTTYFPAPYVAALPAGRRLSGVRAAWMPVRTALDGAARRVLRRLPPGWLS